MQRGDWKGQDIRGVGGGLGLGIGGGRTRTMEDVGRAYPHSQAFPLSNCILQVIKNWTVGRPGNEEGPCKVFYLGTSIYYSNS